MDRCPLAYPKSGSCFSSSYPEGGPSLYFFLGLAPQEEPDGRMPAWAMNVSEFLPSASVRIPVLSAVNQRIA